MKFALLFINVFFFYPIASAGNWIINKDHSEMMFEVPYMEFTEVTGRFNNYAGQMSLDEKQGIPKSLEVRIESSSIDTGNRMRDGHLKGSEFFQSKQFPLIIFKSEDIRKKNTNLYVAIGLMTIKNITKPITIEFSFTNTLKDTWGYEHKFVRFKSKLYRKDFKLNWNKTLENQKFLVGDEISFRGKFQLQPESHKTPSNKHKIPDTPYIRQREKISRNEAPPNSLPKIEIQTMPDVASLKGTEDKVNHSSQAHQTHPSDFNLTWWVSFISLSFFGFLGVTFSGIYAKNFLLKSPEKKYKEQGFLGFASDMTIILSFFIYSLAIWYIGQKGP